MATEPTNQFDIFISYSHDQSRLVQAQKEKLVAAGFSVWIDIENQPVDDESLPEWLSNAIIRSLLILVFFSKSYESSENCQCELMFAKSKKKPILYIRGEANCRPDGWLCFVMKNAIYVDLTGKKYEAQWKTLIERITQGFLNLKSGNSMNFFVEIHFLIIIYFSTCIFSINIKNNRRKSKSKWKKDKTFI